jgi:hypothetical protein
VHAGAGSAAYSSGSTQVRTTPNVRLRAYLDPNGVTTVRLIT